MADSADRPILKTENLSKRYGDFLALDGLSIHLNRGEILGFIGPNGAGKTTTIRVLVGQARPSGGTATIAGVDCLKDARKIKRLVGYMPDTFGSYDAMRVHEYLDFFGAAFGIERTRRVKRIGEVLDLTGAAYMRDLFVESLSHGMKQRLAIARTLLHDPELLILDEPANGLDPEARIEMRRLLLRLAEAGKALLVTSHILPELSRICHRVAIITAGRLRAFGTLEEVRRTVHQNRLFEVQLTSSEALEVARPLVVRFVGESPEGDEAAEVSESTEEAALRFRTAADESELAGLLQQLVAAGIPVSQFREVPSDLEETFLSITRQGES